MYKLDLEKTEEPEIKLPTSAGSLEKQKNSRKASISALFDYAKAFDCVNHNKLWEILKEIEYQTTFPDSWKTCMQIKKQQLEPDMKWQIGSKLRKEYVKACILSSCLFNWNTEYLMQNARLDEAQVGNKIAGRNINNRYHPSGRKQRETKELLDESESH